MHTNLVLACSEHFPEHSKGIRQTPHAPQAVKADTYKLQIVFNCCLHMTSQEMLTGLTCFTLCLRRYLCPSGIAGSACPQVLLSVKIMKATAKNSPLSQSLSATRALSSQAALPAVGNLQHACTRWLECLICIRCQVILRPADAAMLLRKNCAWSICTVDMLLHMHRLHEAHKASNESFASAI